MTADAVPAPSSLSGLVERVVFHNPSTGFCVLRVKLPERSEPVTVVGEAGAVHPGEVVRADGRWQTDPSFGHQFRAANLATLPPSTVEGMAAYLGSGTIKGIGQATAKRLVDAFGTGVFEVIEREPERLRGVPGVGRQLAERIAEAWRESRAVHDIMLFLHSHGLSPLRAARIREAYGDRAIRVVTEDPYRLARDVRGMGFLAADELAGRLGLAPDSPRRLRAGFAHVLGLAVEAGHCALPRGRLIDEAAELLDAEAGALVPELEREIAVHALVEEAVDGVACVFLPDLAEAEAEIAEGLLALARGDPPWPTEDAEARLERVEAELGLGLSPDQRAAVGLALRHKLLVVTGGPGTGKTTLVNALLQTLPIGGEAGDGDGESGGGLDVRLAAPTGRAARRLVESTGRPASTLHRLLEADPGRGFNRNPMRPLECDLLVVDEASMIDVPLMRALVLALPEEAGLVLVGDVDQLPSVGPGRVLADVIASGVCPVVRLSAIFRQAAESRIVTSAHRINQGLLPDLVRPEAGLSDFYAIRADGPEDAARKVLDLVAERVPERFGLSALQDIQVLCPTNKGPLGTRALNERLQAVLNPNPAARLERQGVVFAEGDRVMQAANDYDREVSNGDLGIVTHVDAEARALTVEVDGRPLVYAYDELDALLPAYAITVHKAQGSEYPAIVLPLVMAHGRMLRRNLVYTAVTRARRLCVLVVEPRALELAVAGRAEPRRWSRLRERLTDGADLIPLSTP